MGRSTATKSVLLGIFGAVLTVPCLFFSWYTVRLIYVNLTMTSDEAAAHRTGGMLIGAFAFPLAAIIFGLISWFCITRARRGLTQDREA